MQARARRDEGRGGISGAPAPTDELLVLRMTALRCGAGRRTALWPACSMLSVDGPAQPMAETLVAVLEEALGRPAVFYTPRDTGRSFDELWLLRLFERWRAGDLASVELLIRSRLRPQHQRLFRLLVAGLADRLTALNVPRV